MNKKSKKIYSQHRYIKPNGDFDYAQYCKVQEAGNRRKIKSVWALEENIHLISRYLKDHIEEIETGLCHGTRRGKEQEWFIKYLKCDVLGTEISSTAKEFAHTIQWDFHEVKPEWIEQYDFIYSNSFDHSYDPKKCLRAWMSCLQPGGVCVIEHTSYDTGVSELDPLGIPLEVFPYLVLQWSDGKFCVTDIIDTYKRGKGVKYAKAIILENCK